MPDEQSHIGTAACLLARFPITRGHADHGVLPLLSTKEFANHLRSDIAAWTASRKWQGTPFRYLKSVLRLCTPVCEIRSWETVLTILRDDDPSRYRKLHKGEPFYWLALASYQLRDYEGALFYIDCALSEDLRQSPKAWHKLPAGLFVLLNESNPRQAALDVVKTMRTTFDNATADVNAKFGLNFDIEQYRKCLVLPAISQDEELRSVVTALVTFLLEFTSRRQQISLLADTEPETIGTAEPFFVHLFKGCVIFESLLKFSFDSQLDGTKTLGDVLKSESVFRALGFDSRPESFGSFDAVRALCSKIRNETGSSVTTAIRATWALRNMLGHNLALPARPTAEEYVLLFQHVFAAIARAIGTLPAAPTAD